MVEMIKNDEPGMISLAIGDGANDVSMIKKAHVGIGLFGKEGERAAQTADFAFADFKTLRRLLFHHGRMTYIRNAEMIIYFFYKNFTLCMPTIMFAF